MARGRLFRLSAMASSCAWLCTDRSVPLGRYCLISPLVFSQVPRCQGLCGSQKYTVTPVLAVNSAWRAISLPWSYVSVLRIGSATLRSLAVKPSSADAGGVCQFDQHHQGRAALDQHAHRRAVPRPLDEVAFPVPREGSVIDLRRAHMDAQQLRQLTPPVFTSTARHAFGLGPAQTGDQFAAQLAPGHRIDAGIDGLVRDRAFRFIRPHQFECACNLAGRPSQTQEVLHHAKQHGVRGQLAEPSALMAFASGACAGCASVVADRGADKGVRAAVEGAAELGSCRYRPGGKAGELTADGRWCAAQQPCNGAGRVIVGRHHHDRCALFSCELFVMFAHGGTLPDGCCT